MFVALEQDKVLLDLTQVVYARAAEADDLLDKNGRFKTLLRLKSGDMLWLEIEYTKFQQVFADVMNPIEGRSLDA